MMYEFILAAALLTSPDAKVDDATLDVLRPTLIALALDQQILDPREKTIGMAQTH